MDGSKSTEVIVSVRGLSKTYAKGFQALKNIDLEIRHGEIFALLGPNGAGKTTLINIICGVVTPSAGVVAVDGHDIVRDYRAARCKIGLVPQELATDTFERVIDTVTLSRGLFGLPRNPAALDAILDSLSLADKKYNRIRTLSGGMKRRVMIAKALSHEPKILFLDEPSAGVDVELRRDMWELVRGLRKSGVTIILTTHYIEEAEEMADRIGIIDHGQLILVEEKKEMLRKLGKKKLTVSLSARLASLPPALREDGLSLSEDGTELIYNYDTRAGHGGIPALMKKLVACNISFTDLRTQESSLEEIFVTLVEKRS